MKYTYPVKQTKDHSFTELVKGFKTPSGEYAPALMWFWNSEITKEGVTFQLEKFKEQKIANFFIHPARGLTLEYMGEEFMELIKHAVSEAKRLDMKFWIYDELDWPSGAVGGKLFDKYPETRQKFISCHKITTSTMWRIGVSNSVAVKGDFISAVRRNPVTGLVTDVTDKCEVTKAGDITQVTYKNTSKSTEEISVFFSEYNETTVFSSLAPADTRGARGYIDMFSYDAVTKYIEMTHEVYKKAIGDEFGKTVPGVFTDEPTTLYHFWAPSFGPWSDIFPEEFEKDHGYSILPYIHALFYIPQTDLEAKARNDYYETMKRLYHKNFCGQISEWCHENGLIFTGHFGGEESLGGHVSQGDMQTELMNYLDIPGLDSIYSADKINDYNFNTAAKLVESAAKFAGKDRILCETYTLSGVDFRLWEMRRIANRLMTLGVNMIQYMGAHYANSEGSKAILGSVAGYFNPVFNHLNVFADYTAAPSYLSASTTPVSGTLVFIPLKAYANGGKFVDDRHGEASIQKLYEDTINALLYEGIGYDLISEDLADKVTVKDGVINAFGFDYDTIIFPSMDYINKKTADLINKIKAAGVKVIFVNRTPKTVLDDASAFNFTFDFEKDKNAYFITNDDFDAYKSALRDIIGNRILNIESDIRYYVTERENDSASVYFIINDDCFDGFVTIDELAGMKIFSADNKEEKVFTRKDGRITFDIRPFEMVVIIRDKASKEMPVSPVVKTYSETRLLTTKDLYDFEPVGGNIMALTCDMYDEKSGTWIATDGFDFPLSIHIMPNTEYKLRSRFICACSNDEIYLNIEARGIRRIKVNGINVPASINNRFWSDHDCKVKVGPYLVFEDNVIEFDFVTEDNNHVSRPPFMFLSGDLGAHVEIDFVTGRAKKIKSGPLNYQGFRYFIGTGIYRFDATVDEDFEKAEILLDTPDVAKVYVNGEYAGMRVWNYEDVDITKHLKKGRNSFEVHLTVPMANIYGKKIGAHLTAFAVPVGINSPVAIKFYK